MAAEPADFPVRSKRIAAILGGGLTAGILDRLDAVIF